MAKFKSIKNAKSGKSNAFANKNTDIRKSKISTANGNPFEVHINREKISIVGRKLKHDKGTPGISRSKATKKRKETLGREFIEKHKVNKFKDNRVGKRGMSKEDAAGARFVAERLNQYKSKKQALFNLNDNEELLTHKGQTLEEIEQFQDTISDDEDDDKIGKLDAKFTGAAHFGGDNAVEDGKHRIGAIEDLIAEQKRRKAEISHEKEIVSELTHKLDANWRSLIPLMDLNKEEEAKLKPDDFDRALKEMVFEPRGTVTDKLNSEEKILRKEKARLERFEQERLERMRGVTEKDKKVKHRSADDLDDGYFLQPALMDQQTLTYNLEGEPHQHDDDSDEELERMIKESRDQQDSFERNSKNGADNEGDEDVADDAASDLSENESSDVNHLEEDDFSDLVYDSASEPEPEKTKDTIFKKAKKNRKPSTSSEASVTTFTEEDRKAMMAKAEKELPYTFETPQKYEELEKLLKKYNADYQAVILERMIKCNHPKIEPTNREQMVALFAFLLQHVNDLAATATVDNVGKCFAIFDRIAPYLYDLSHLNPAETTRCFLGVIKEKQADFQTEKQYPTLDTLLFFKLVASLYSTSDFRHTVVSPSVILISQILTHSRISNRTHISSGLFLATVLLEYAQLSRRFLPAAINFLTGVIFLCIPKRSVQQLKVIPPFKAQGEHSSLLVLSKRLKAQEEEQLSAKDLVKAEIDESFKVRALNTALLLANNMCELLSENCGVVYLAEPLRNYLDQINFKKYPAFVSIHAENLKRTVERINSKPLSYLVPALRKPKALRQLEPKFERVFDDKYDRNRNAGKSAVHNGLMRKIKKETKGAVREIRRDVAFLAKVQLKRRMQSDTERKEKVRRIFSEASIQQGELNALDRKKKHL